MLASSIPDNFASHVLFNKLGNFSPQYIHRQMRLPVDGATPPKIPIRGDKAFLPYLRFKPDAILNCGSSQGNCLRALVDLYNLKFQMMMRWLLLVVCLSWSSLVFGTDYYVGGSGASDNNPGTATQPFATIQKAASVAKAGDVVNIRGGVYRETIVPSSGSTFKSDNGANVIISGLNELGNDGWSVHNGGIYKKSITLPVNGYASNITSTTSLLANQLFRNGDMMIEARWPKVANAEELFDQLKGRKFLPASAFGATSLNDASIPVPAPGLTGATMICNGWFVTESRTITSHSGSTLSYNAIWSDPNAGPRVRRNYYVTGKLALLTQQKEWHYENGTLYFWQEGGGSPTGVEYKARNWGFDLRGKSNVNIVGLTFKGCDPVNGDDNTNNNVVDNIRATFTNHNVRHDVLRWQGVGMTRQMGLKLTGKGNVLKNSEISWSASGAVWIGADGRVENNLIHHIGYDASFCYGVDLWGEDHVNNVVLTRNTVHTTSRGCFGMGYMFTEFDHRRSLNKEISYNDCYNWGLLNQDGGAIYAWGYQDHTGSRIHHNWFHDAGFKANPLGITLDGIQVAVYFDQGSGPFTVDHNVFWGNCENLKQDASDVYDQQSFNGGAGGARNNGGSKFYNNTFWSNAPMTYTTYCNTPADMMRNNISRKTLNFNWGKGTSNVANALLTGTNPQFQGGDLGSLKGLYFRLSTGSPARNAGVAVPGITDGAVGAPDIGAYEFGGEEWVPGYRAVSVTPAPNTPPTVAITAPSNNAAFVQGANVNITANASDNAGVTKVEFYNGSTKIGEDLTSPYAFAWNSVPAGTHNLTARATDNQNATTTSAVIKITVTPSANPVVAITAPTNNATIAPGTNVTINATATVSSGTIAKVEFFDGATKLGEDTSSPYSFTWNSPALGAHALMAKATDNSSKSTTSTVVNVSVAANAAPPAAPTASITAPSNNASFTQGAAIAISATASSGVTKVEFYNGTTKVGEDTSSPYAYTWTGAPLGSHSLTVKAFTETANATSAAVLITVAAAPVASNVPPTISLTSPTSSQEFATGSNVTITATAADSDGSIALVEFFVANEKVGESKSAPYSITWNTQEAGTYPLTAMAWDDKSAVTKSAEVEISIAVEGGESPDGELTAQIPRFFSPNGDGNGDTWIWADDAKYANAAVSVFNRAGEKVYQSASYNNTWDGRSEGRPLQDGDYYYVIRLADQTELRGALRIVR